jgi:hypothetical protein
MDDTVPALEDRARDKRGFDCLLFLVDLKTQPQPIGVIFSTGKTITARFQFHLFAPVKTFSFVVKAKMPVPLSDDGR